MDVSFVIQQRLKELGIEQRDLAAAAQVTESYISQLLTRKKAPPAVERTDLYEKMNGFLKFPPGHLTSLAQAQQREELKRKLADPPPALFPEVRDLVLRKCREEVRAQLREIFERQAFGELERLVNQTLLDVAKAIAREELKNEDWLRGVARLGRKSYEETRATILEFLDTDVFNLSAEHCSVFLDLMIDSWDLELKSFAMDIQLTRRIGAARQLHFQYVQTRGMLPAKEEPGFKEFLRNLAMSGEATAEELDFLKSLKFKQRSPSPLYYYRELQSLRDPLHFRGSLAGAKSAASKKRRQSAVRLRDKKRAT